MRRRTQTPAAAGAYPDQVHEEVVTRSNAIMAALARYGCGFSRTAPPAWRPADDPLHRGWERALSGYCTATQRLWRAGALRSRRCHPSELRPWHYFRRSATRVFCLHAYRLAICAALLRRRATCCRQQRLRWNAQLRGHALRCDHAGSRRTNGVPEATLYGCPARSGTRRPVSHITSTLRPASTLEPST